MAVCLGVCFRARVRRSSTSHPQNSGRCHGFGTPGTITDEQISALKDNLFEPTKEWSFDEAALILDAVTYLRGVCKEVLRNEQPPLKLQNELLAFILEDQDLRDYVRRWGEDRRKAEINGKATKLKHNNQFKRVAKKATDLAEG